MYSTGSHVQFRQQGRYPKPRSANESIHCDVCKITVKGADQFNTHMTGSKHAKKLKELENMKKAEEIPYLRYDDGSGGFECTVCNVSLNSSSVAMFHVVGNRHQEAVKALNPSENSEAAPEKMESSNGDAGVQQTAPKEIESVEADVLQNAGLPTEFGSTKVVATDKTPTDQPFKANARPNIGPEFRYNVKPLASSFVSKYTTHTVEATESTSRPPAPRPRKNPNAAAPKGGGGVQKFPCLACNIVTNSETQLQAHLASPKHNSRLGSSGTNGSDAPPPPAVSATFRCESCNITVNSQIQLDQHLQSPKHRQKLQKRYEPYPRPGQQHPGQRPGPQYPGQRPGPQYSGQRPGPQYSGQRPGHYSGQQYSGQQYSGQRPGQQYPGQHPGHYRSGPPFFTNPGPPRQW